MNIKFAFTPEERQSILDGLEIVLDSLVDYEKSLAELRKIEDLRTFFIYISNRPSVLVEVKKP